MTLEELLKETPPMQIHAVVKGFQAGMETSGKQVIELRQQVTLLRGLLTRYRNETPVGNQPHMICNEVDAALSSTEPNP